MLVYNVIGMSTAPLCWGKDNMSERVHNIILLKHKTHKRYIYLTFISSIKST